MPDSFSSTEFASKTAILQKRGYKILSKLGEGSYAKVYLGEFVPRQLSDEQPQPPIKLAVKIMNNKRKKLEFNRKFLPRELNVLTIVSHPHIIHIHSILQVGHMYYIFMRFAEQGDLLDFILKYGVINENQARVWARQIALAIQYLHELNIAHRDIRCENILVTTNYNVKLSDFGFARYTVDPGKMPVMSETYCGTLSYVSPEILLGRPYNAKISDLWSFGVVIYVMLNKAMPFEDNSPKGLYEKQLNRSFKFRSKVIDLLSNEVKTLVQHLLEPDPTKRYCAECIVNSDWVAMDKRLTALNPLELAAQSYAVEHRLAPPENLCLSCKAVPKTPSEVTEESISSDKSENESKYSLSIIKPSTCDQPRISENSKIDRFPE